MRVIGRKESVKEQLRPILRAAHQKFMGGHSKGKKHGTQQAFWPVFEAGAF
jgi:hypothetical protein